MKVLVTGAAGFIGSHLAERLTARGDVVVGLDNFDAYYDRAIKEANLAGLRGAAGFRLVEGDIRAAADLDRALSAAGGAIDCVVHLAALAGVQPSLREPERYYDVNVMGTVRLLEACRRHEARGVVFGSSSSVYGLDSTTPFREDDRCARPASPYAATKRAGELLAFNVHHLARLPLTCLRFFTVYGPRQRPDLAIHKFTRLIARGQPIELFGDGSSSRDYTWIDDIIDGVVAAVDRQARERHAGAPPGYHIYNLGGAHTISLARLTELLGRALGVEPKVVRKPDQPGDLLHTHADVSLAARELGYAPKVTPEEGLPRFVAWWRGAGASG